MSQANEALWYAVHTQPRGEMKAAIHLQRQNFLTYLPLLQKKIRHARRVENVRRPFFPRYLFVALNLSSQGWHAIRSTVGVSEIVCFGNQPTPLPRGVIEELKGHQDDNGCISFGRHNTVKSGDAVVVRGGPFSMLLGYCESVSENERITVLLDLLGRKVRVSLDMGTIEAG